MSSETRALARRYKLDVSTDNATWIPVHGIQDFADVPKDTMQDVTDYDTNGFASSQKTLSQGELTVKMTRILSASVLDPGQEIIRATKYQFGDASMVYARWYDRNGQPEAWTAQMTPSWSPSKTAAADVEEVTVKMTSNGAVTAITNPYSVTNIPVITSITPANAAAGTLVNVVGAYLTGATAVKFGATAATLTDVVSDSLIVAEIPSTSTGTVTVTVTTPAGTSVGTPYTV